MARWGFISDVHGNRPALERALALCQARHVERLVYLGDLLGRGDSDSCVRLVRATAALSVVGNRDLDWSERVGAESRAYVLGLPRVAEAGDFLAIHGDSRLTPQSGSDDLRRGFRRTYRWLQERGRRLIFFGHTHQARVWRKTTLDAEPELLAGHLVLLPPSDGTIYVVNVGTTGLPFPGKGPPSCAVYDDLDRRLEHVELGSRRGAAPGQKL